MKSDLDDEKLAERLEEQFVRQHDENINIVSSTETAEAVVADTILDPAKKKALEDRLYVMKEALAAIESRLQEQKAQQLREAETAAVIRAELQHMSLSDKLALVERINHHLNANGEFFGDSKKLVNECYLKILKLVDHSL